MPDVCSRFLEQARRRPDHPAVVADAETATYGELADTARRIAAVVARFGPAPRILIHLPQQAAAYAAMFGCGLAGAVYAPTNCDAPTAKHRALLERFRPDAVVSVESRFQTLIGDGDGPPLIDVDALPDLPSSWSDPAWSDPARSEQAARPGGSAYVIFTSGSTGTPKGVEISRAALAHYVDWALTAMNVTPDDRWSQHPNIAFDLSVLDVYGALCGGATLYPLTGAKDRLMPASAIARRRLTIWNSVPSVMGLMMQAGQATAENFASLRLLTFCGEPLLPEHLDAIFAARPNVVVHNTYGPTEATVSCTLVRLTVDDYRRSCGATVAVGDAIPGMEIHLVDGPDDDEGELVIAGPQLAEGYWRDPQTTAGAFRDRKIGDRDLRVYHTGDWFRRTEGRLTFVRRMDAQVKIGGYRLELEEVNAALRRCGVAAAAAVLVDGRLHAFLEAGPDGEIDVGRLRADLSTKIEAHATPAHFHVLPVLPRSANDKIDLQALKALLMQEH